MGLLVLACAAACSSSNAMSGDGGAMDMATSSDGPATTSTMFQITPVTGTGCAQAGLQTVIATGPSNLVALASLAIGTGTTACMSGAMISNYNICYAESSGSAFATQVAATTPYSAVTGIGVAFDSSGNPSVAFTGGVTSTTDYCGSSQMAMATRTAGTWGTPQVVATSSMSDGVASNGQTMACVQNVCNQGDVTGFWPSLGFDSNNQPAIAFQDRHNGGISETDTGSADLEFYQHGAGEQLLTIDVGRGGGLYNRLVFDPMAGGKAVVAYYNDSSINASANGLWVSHQGTGVTWNPVHVSSVTAGSIDEPFGFAVSSAGLYSVAYYSQKNLLYLESSDGVTWGQPSIVDEDGNVGRYPSLAFAPDGQPAISYYRCNDYSATGTSCDTEKDGLRYARRANGKWQISTVSATSGVTDGTYTALAFSNGKAVIAFQTATYDPGTMKTTLALDVAREQ